MDDPTPAEEFLAELQQHPSKLLDVVAQVKELGVTGLPKPPKIVVCGARASGKSSVIEAISGIEVPYGETDSDRTTFATEYIIQRRSEPSMKVWIEAAPFNGNHGEMKQVLAVPTVGRSPSDDLPEILQKAKELMGAPTITEDILKVEIAGPKRPDVILVDLPGLYNDQGQADQEAELVRKITKRYMQSLKNVILAIISADAPFNTQDVPVLAVRYDLARERTMGIITHPDTVEPDSDVENNCLGLLANEKFHLDLGWHVLRNRSPINHNTHYAVRDALERHFLSEGAWADVPRQMVGINSLRRRLGEVLFNYYIHHLPSLIAGIQTQVFKRELQLSNLSPPFSKLQDPREHLLNMSYNFDRILKESLIGHHSDKFFPPPDVEIGQLRVEIRRLSDLFKEAMNSRGATRRIHGQETGFPSYPTASQLTDNPYMAGYQPTYIHRHVLEAQITERFQDMSDSEPLETRKQNLVDQLFHVQSEPWKELAKAHILKVFDIVHKFTTQLLQHLAGEQTASLLKSTFFKPALSEFKTDVLDKLGELVGDARKGHRLSGSVWEFSSREESLFAEPPVPTPPTPVMNPAARRKSSIGAHRRKFRPAEIVDHMQSRYDIAIGTFVNNVLISGIEECLIEPLKRLFTYQSVSEMDDTQIQQLTAEKPETSETRKRLATELQTLEEALRTLTRYNDVPQTSPKPSTTSKKWRSRNSAPGPKCVRFKVDGLEIPAHLFASSPDDIPTPEIAAFTITASHTPQSTDPNSPQPSSSTPQLDTGPSSIEIVNEGVQWSPRNLPRTINAHR
ncbi:P-loop containing nucleoside triphosphate hydrolase protein [Aspergillus karnatakaensis]|uniref:dynamin family protein n=1 Tax=Aspergillus karnatakaensis TaxID=1810916 RepID=UPI003CCCE97D